MGLELGKLKLKKTILVSLIVVLFLAILFCVYYYLLTSGDIPFNFQKRIFMLYMKSGLRSRIKMVLDYRDKFYYCKNDSIEFPPIKSYVLANLIFEGTFYDDDYNLFFASGSLSFFEELEELNKTNFISEKDYFKNIKGENIEEKLENMIFLKRSSLWSSWNYGELTIKLYNDGEFILFYTWWDGETFAEQRKKRYKKKIPMKKELSKELIDQIDFTSFEKFHTYDTYWDKLHYRTGFIIKKGQKVKIVNLEDGFTEREKDLKNLWDKIIKLGKIEEIITDEINKGDFTIISKDRLEIIYRWLSLDNKY